MDGCDPNLVQPGTLNRNGRYSRSHTIHHLQRRLWCADFSATSKPSGCILSSKAYAGLDSGMADFARLTLSVSLLAASSSLRVCHFSDGSSSCSSHWISSLLTFIFTSCSPFCFKRTKYNTHFYPQQERRADPSPLNWIIAAWPLTTGRNKCRCNKSLSVQCRIL